MSSERSMVSEAVAGAERAVAKEAVAEEVAIVGAMSGATVAELSGDVIFEDVADDTAEKAVDVKCIQSSFCEGVSADGSDEEEEEQQHDEIEYESMSSYGGEEAVDEELRDLEEELRSVLAQGLDSLEGIPSDVIELMCAFSEVEPKLSSVDDVEYIKLASSDGSDVDR